MRKKTTNQSRKVLPFPARAPQPAPTAPAPQDRHRDYMLFDWPPNDMHLRDGDVLRAEVTDFIEPGDLIVLTWPDESKHIMGYFDVTPDTGYLQLTRPGFAEPVLRIPPHLGLKITGRVGAAYRRTAAGAWARGPGCKLNLRARSA